MRYPSVSYIVELRLSALNLTSLFVSVLFPLLSFLFFFLIFVFVLCFLSLELSDVSLSSTPRTTGAGNHV